MKNHENMGYYTEFMRSFISTVSSTLVIPVFIVNRIYLYPTRLIFELRVEVECTIV